MKLAVPTHHRENRPRRPVRAGRLRQLVKRRLLHPFRRIRRRESEPSPLTPITGTPRHGRGYFVAGEGRLSPAEIVEHAAEASGATGIGRTWRHS
jgi:hypothetical protein